MITIRHWQPDDASVLCPMILDLLASNVAGELLPTERNVRVLFELGLDWTLKREPTLVACNGNGTVIGFTLWGDLGNPLKLDVRDRLCTGIGTYVTPTWRQKGIASRLRREASKLMQGKYDRVCGVAYHEAGLKSMLRIGAKAIGTMTEWCV